MPFTHLLTQAPREEEHAAALKKYADALKRWEGDRDAHQSEQERLRRRFEEERLTSVEAMHDLLAEAFQAIHWPHETLVSFEIEQNGKLLRLDVDLPEVEAVPRRSAAVAARGLKLNFHEFSESQVRKAHLAYIHGILFRVVGEGFATLPTVDTIECSGFSQPPDPATGRTRDEYLLSVRVTRRQWEQIDFTKLDQVDPVASLERFELRRDATASGMLAPITPFRESMTDEDLVQIIALGHETRGIVLFV